MKLHLLNALKIVTIMMCLVTIITNLSIAGGFNVKTFKGTISEGANVNSVREIMGTILDVVRLIGTGVAIIMLIYIGIKIMLASPSERANIKQYSINYVIGAFILIGASGILKIVKDFATQIGS